MKARYAWLVLLFTASQLSQAGSVTTGLVTSVGTYGNGNLFITLNATINETGCASSRFDVPSTHPEISNWLALASTALSTGKKLVVYTSGCYEAWPGYFAPTLNANGNQAYIYLAN